MSGDGRMLPPWVASACGGHGWWVWREGSREGMAGVRCAARHVWAASFHSNRHRPPFQRPLPTPTDITPHSNGLFQAAISESGGLGASSLSDAIHNTKAVARAAGCDEKGEGLKACMQRLTDLQITSMTYSGSWGPTVDGVTIPRDPMEMLTEGHVNPAVEAVVFGAQVVPPEPVRSDPIRVDPTGSHRITPDPASIGSHWHRIPLPSDPAGMGSRFHRIPLDPVAADERQFPLLEPRLHQARCRPAE